MKRHSQRLRDILRRGLAIAVTVPMMVSFAPVAFAEDGAGTGNGSATPSASSGLNLLASYDFSDGTATDTSGNGYNLTMNGGAKVEAFGDRNNNQALSLRGNGQYASFPDELFAKAGNSFTMEFAAKSRHADDGNYFSFSVGGSQQKYLFWYLSTKSTKFVISDNKWNNEQGFKTSLSNNDNIWHNYKLIVDGETLTMLRDGELVGYKANTGITMADLGSTAATIGKSLYSGDAYWSGAIDDIKIYQGADVTLPSSVTIVGDGVLDGALTMVENSAMKLTATVSPENAISTDVTWESSKTSVATVGSDGTVTAVGEGTTTITATTKAGGVSASVDVTVKPLDPATVVQFDLDSAISAVNEATTENLPLISTGSKYGSTITWTSSNENVITGTDTNYQAPSVGSADPYKGAGVVTRPAYGDGDAAPVELTATAANADGSVTKTAKVSVIVKEKTREVPDEAYAAVTFLSDSDKTNGKTGEALYMSATEGNNFFSFKEINNSNPVIESYADTKGLRDPYVLKSHDGDKYYMIATDLKVSAQGWGQNQQYGSLKVEVWESKDMVNWTRTNAADGDTGIKINVDNAGMTWAPEAYWDDSLGAYVVFFSSRMYTDDTRSTAVTSTNTGYAYNVLLYCITRDFKTFTEPVMWQDTNYSRIDSTVIKVGDYYYRFTKNEESGAAGSYITNGKSTFLERSKVLTATTEEASPDTDPETGWQLLDQRILPFEGPEAIKLNAGDKYQNEAGDAMVIMADSGGYQPYMTSESALLSCDWNNRLSQTDGWHTQKDQNAGVSGYVYANGMPTPTRHGAFVNVPAAIAENMHRWTTANPTTPDATDSTTKLERGRDTLTATVTAKDGGNVAGSVVFTAGDWTETVKLNADGVATVTAPEGALGKVSKITAAYGGYTDNLVNVSDDAIEQTPDPDPTPDPTPDPDPTPAPTTKPGTTTTKKTAKKAAVVVNTGANVKGIALVAAILAIGGALAVLRRWKAAR